MDILFLIYGLSFLVMGLVVVIRYDRDSQLELSGILWLLAAFGFSHGFREWMDLWRVVRGDDTTLALAWPLVLLVSYVFLFEFGRRLLRTALSPESRAGSSARLLEPWTYVPLLAGIAAGTAFADRPEIALDVWSRYLLGFPGAVLAGVGFLTYGGRRIVAVLDVAGAARVRSPLRLRGAPSLPTACSGAWSCPGWTGSPHRSSTRTRFWQWCTSRSNCSVRPARCWPRSASASC
jgi:hypothetical protein